jgi:cbb3-type cytochrome oxidase maturation protein
MNILLLLIPLSLLLLGAAIWAFSWAVRRGQFEDLDTPALDILREDASERTSARRSDPRAGKDGGTRIGGGAGDTSARGSTRDAD